MKRSHAEALQWWYKVAIQGHAEAQFNLGASYAAGLDVAQDHVVAAQWFQMAAQQGHAEAKNNLGLMYAMGQGVPHDLVRAHLWYSLAAAGGDALALENRNKLIPHVTPQQIAEAEQLAREWRPELLPPTANINTH